MLSPGEELSIADLAEAVETMKSGLLAHATGDKMDESVYGKTRKLLLGDSRLHAHLPRFVKTCRTTHEFWGFIELGVGSNEIQRTGGET